MSLVVAEHKCLPRILCVGFTSAELNALTRAASGAFILLAAPAGHPVSTALEGGAYAAVVCRMPVGSAALGLGRWSLTPVVNAPHPFDALALAAELAAELDRPGHEPRQRGRLVLEGIRRNDLYILTHPEFEPAVRERVTLLLNSFSTEPVPEGRRLATQAITPDIYAADLARKGLPDRLE